MGTSQIGARLSVKDNILELWPWHWEFMGDTTWVLFEDANKGKELNYK